MLPAPHGRLCARGLGPWEAESERLLVPVTHTLQLLLYQRPFSCGQARNPEAIPYLTRSVHTDCPAIRRGGRTMGALWKRRSGLDYLIREWWSDSLSVVESRTRANCRECQEAVFNAQRGRTFYPFRAVQKEKILSEVIADLSFMGVSSPIAREQELTERLFQSNWSPSVFLY